MAAAPAGQDYCMLGNDAGTATCTIDGWSPDTGEEADESAAYQTFYRAVAEAQLQAWLPARRRRVLDLSAPDVAPAARLAAAGHEVLRLLDPEEVRPRGCLAVRADRRSVDAVADASVDAVVAEGATLSGCLFTEATLAELRRVLRPNGRLLASVDSLLSGLARLAEQGRWAELADSPSAEVVLIEGTDGLVRRCFWADDLHTLLTEAGFEVEWIRPRTVISPATAVRAVAAGPAELARVVRTELELAAQHQGEGLGNRLVVSARRRR